MIRKVPLSVSCDIELIKRLSSSVEPNHRSKFCEEAIRVALDKLDKEVAHKKKHDEWITHKVVPALKTILKKKGYGEMLELWNGTPETRKYLIHDLKITMSDESLKQALSEVMADYE